MPLQQTKLPPMIAIVGCDGSGKSTVNAQALAWVKKYSPAESAHLGKQGGNVGRALNNIPLIGKWIEKVQKTKGAKVHEAQKLKKTPEFLPSFVMYLFAIRRLRRYKRMLALRQKGMVMITDRYPQLEFPQAIDGPGLDVDATGSKLVCWMAKKEHKAFEWMTSYVPDVVIRLNVDIDTACARKPDHTRKSLIKKISIMPQLKFNGAPIVEIDTLQPLDDVVKNVQSAISKTLEEKGYTRE